MPKVYFPGFIISYPVVYIILTLNQTPLEMKLSLSIGNNVLYCNVLNQSPSVIELREFRHCLLQIICTSTL
jgi:hypothetical protein